MNKKRDLWYNELEALYKDFNSGKISAAELVKKADEVDEKYSVDYIHFETEYGAVITVPSYDKRG